jgi:hypothetical protein
MPLGLQAEGIRAGLLQPLDTTDLLRQVGEALALCDELRLQAELDETETAYA